MLVLLATATLACADGVAPLPLFDFEGGIAGWSGNPWGGGQCAPSLATEAKFGQGALRATYTEIKQGGNVIAPYFPDDAPWRSGEYDRICLWLKGDGSASYLNLQLETGDRDKPNLYSARIPLDSKRWHRVCLKFDTFWNRYDTPFDLRTLQRLYFGVTGTHEALIDQISLQQPLRQVPLVPLDNGGPAAMTPELYADRDGRYFLTFDPQTVLEPTVSADLTVTWPLKQGVKLLKTFAAQAATEELWIALPQRPDAEGEARLTVRLAEPANILCYQGAFTFPVVLGRAQPEPTALQLVPQPKQLVYHPGKLDLRQVLRVHVLSQPDLAVPVVRRLQTELKQWFGVELKYSAEKLYPNEVALLVITPEDEAPKIPQEVRDKLPELRVQGYVLHVDADGIVLAAQDAEGLRNAATTLLQAVRSASPSAVEVQAPALTIADWPTCQWRAINIGLPTTRWGHPNDAPVPVDYFIDYLRRTVVEQKVNLVGLEIAQGMKYDKHPEIAGPAAYTKAEVGRIVSFLRDNGVEVFPLIEALGHANWLVIPHPELREDGDEHTLCTRNPKTRQILADCFSEALEVFGPRYFHFGLDEIRWVTDTVAAEKRCPLCKGVDKRDLFVEQVKWLHDFAATSNVQMMMWADMILREHNGGAPFNLADTVGKLPLDIVMCDWSTSLSPLSLWELQRKGFPVLKSNSCGVTGAQAPSVIGNMWGIWAKTPWLTESCWRIEGYAYPRQLVAAEYGWNPYPDLLANEVPCLPEFFTKRPLAQQRLAMKPEPAGGRPVVSLSPGDKTIILTGLRLQPFAAAVTAETELPVGKPAAAVYLLLGADLPAAERTKFLDLFKQGVHWQGVPIGEFQVTLADGTTETQPIRYGTHVRAVALDEPFPQVLEALGQAPVGERMAYVVQWVNPRPQSAVTSLRFIPGALAARPVWLGAAVREVMKSE